MTNVPAETFHDESKALEALRNITQALAALDHSDRRRVVESVLAFFSMNNGMIPPPIRPSQHYGHSTSGGAQTVSAKFSDDRSMSPKQFMMEKQPKTDVERIACLAYYLTHFRDTPHFKTLDLTKLNTDAAQPKFTNPTRSAANAVDYGYLAPATKGNRQLSAGGELFIQSLPNREAAKAAMANVRPRAKKMPGRRKAGSNEET